MMSVTSSRTPLRVVNSCATPSIFTERDGGALERGEQHATERVAERVAEAAVERLDDEDAALLVDLLVRDPRHLEFHERRSCSHASFFFYFE